MSVELRSARLLLRLPDPEADAERVAAYWRANRAHFAPVTPARPEGFETAAHWRAQLAANRDDLAADRSMCLYAFLASDGDDAPPVGAFNFKQFVRGPFQSCVLGYSIDQRHEGRGLVSEGLRPAIDHVFDVLGLHRIAANHLPGNARSAAVLKRLGFSVEGYAREYLFIDGKWRDHVLTALVKSTERPWSAAAHQR